MSVGLARLREEPEAIRKGAIDKGEDPTLVDAALEADARRRALQGEGDTLRAERNAASKSIGEAIKGGATPDGPEVAALRARCDRVTEVPGLARGIEVPALREALVPAPGPAGPAAPRAASSAMGSLATDDAHRRALADVLEVRPGDYVIHRAHGVARYGGLERRGKSGEAQDYLVLEFAGESRLFVPASGVDAVQKYVGHRGAAPALSTLGSRAWRKKTSEARAAVERFARDLLAVAALREKGYRAPFPADTRPQREFEEAFPWTDTPDQVRATAEIKADLSAPRPMDRLLCGDVGYGKTEVALRAVFKVVEAGRQAAVLVPTTILALQHGAVFSARLAPFPFTVEVLSRFRTRREQKAVLERVAAGGVDVLVGTHRMLEPDVKFKDLGLVLVDEEQRFGVQHKERLKRLRALVDVLTLTATPIPRTLHMALLGVRDISTLATPPPNRLAVETRVARLDPDLVAEAIRREIARGGQCFVVHNWVRGIERVADLVRSRVPEARTDVVHGQLPEDAIESRMAGFLRRETDVLVTTAIIESGLDIPSANTLIVTDAHRYGLADLHQLRGRVGRGTHRALALFLLGEGPTTESAEKRIRAIEEFADLGSGFALAIRDLEIRGAGNLLGPEQHGHLAAVGYELYCRLLREAVSRATGRVAPPLPEVGLDFRVEAHVPERYVPDLRQRLAAYRRFGSAEGLAEVDAWWEEVSDRYGPPPPPVAAVAELARVRVLAPRAGLVSLAETDEDVIGRYEDAGRARVWARLHPEKGGLRVVDERTVYVRKGARKGIAVLRFLRGSLERIPAGPSEARP